MVTSLPDSGVGAGAVSSDLDIVGAVDGPQFPEVWLTTRGFWPSPVEVISTLREQTPPPDIVDTNEKLCAPAGRSPVEAVVKPPGPARARAWSASA